MLTNQAKNRIINSASAASDQRGQKKGMDESTNRAEELYRTLGERLSGDSSLRDALTDEQAQRLLDWALAQVRDAVERAEAAPEPEAEMAEGEEVAVEEVVETPEADDAPLVESRFEAVRQVMRQANKMVEELPQASSARTREYMLQFLDALCEVDARAVQVNDMMDMEQMALNREELGQEAIFERLMAIIRQENEEE
jgi:uncharacterized membrane protein YccC